MAELESRLAAQTTETERLKVCMICMIQYVCSLLNTVHRQYSMSLILYTTKTLSEGKTMRSFRSHEVFHWVEMADQLLCDYSHPGVNTHSLFISQMLVLVFLIPHRMYLCQTRKHVLINSCFRILFSLPPPLLLCPLSVTSPSLLRWFRGRRRACRRAGPTWSSSWPLAPARWPSCRRRKPSCRRTSRSPRRSRTTCWCCWPTRTRRSTASSRDSKAWEKR